MGTRRNISNREKIWKRKKKLKERLGVETTSSESSVPSVRTNPATKHPGATIATAHFIRLMDMTNCIVVVYLHVQTNPIANLPYPNPSCPG